MTQEDLHIAFKDIRIALNTYRDRTALIDKEGNSYTYSELKRYITGARSELEKRGVKKGAKVLVFVPMSLELYAILEGIFSLGATAIFLDPWMKGKKMGSIIEQVHPDLFVVTKQIARVSWLLKATWPLKKWKVDQINPNDDDWKIVPVNDDDNALITFTSGTSGKPKGANRSFGFLNGQATTLKPHLQSKTDLPFVDYTNFPIVGLANFGVGNTVVIPRLNLMKIHKADENGIIAQFQSTLVSRVIVSPSLLQKIVKGAHGKDGLRIQQVVTGGAPIALDLIQECLKNFPEVEFEAIFGSTEAEPICISPFEEIAKQMQEPLRGVYVGKPVPQIKVKIIDFVDRAVKGSELNSLELAQGERGEIIVTGAHVNKTYYENPEAFERNKIVDETGQIWHRTGDIGYFHEDQLLLVGRDHRIYQHEGQKIYPYPIEQYLMATLGFDDMGYHQNNKGEFVVYVGTLLKVHPETIKATTIDAGYPCDKVIVMEELPRDARHKSKLLIEELKG